MAYDRRNLNLYHRGGGGNPLPSSYRNKALLIVGATALYTAFLYHSGTICFDYYCLMYQPLTWIYSICMPRGFYDLSTCLIVRNSFICMRCISEGGLHTATGILFFSCYHPILHIILYFYLNT